LSAPPVRRRVLARGLVQGVFFRESVRRQAEDTGVAGWVRNCPDGSVEAVFEGDPGAVEALVAFCRRGPAHAQVQAVECCDEPPKGIGGFEVR